jgi:hypothetical protein
MHQAIFAQKSNDFSAAQAVEFAMKNAVDVNNIKCIHQTKNLFKHEPCPDFISKENFIQAIQFGNGNCTIFLVEFKTTFSIITCMGS